MATAPSNIAFRRAGSWLCGRRLVFAGAVLVLAGLWSAEAYAQEEPSRRSSGAVMGRVQDVETGEPVGWTQILLEEANRSTAADADGHFKLINIRAGTYTLQTFRIGYEPLERRVEVPASDTLHVTLQLASSAVAAGEVVVEGLRDTGEGLGDPDVALEDRRLRQQLGATIAKTLENEPGLAMRSMGPAPARPVLRGLGGERLLVLEDGGRTGDLSHTSSDHAVVIEPMTAERVEVLRGPGALLYGSNTLGGVVNVERGYVPSSRPDDLEFILSSQAESVNQGLSGGFSAAAPVGPLAMGADGSLRAAQDMHTPAGVLENTGLGTTNASVGASLVESWGFAGVGGSLYESEYGIPGGFVGAHPNGVSIKLNRRHLEARADYLPGPSALSRLELRGRYTRYHHQEFESDDVLGIEFGVVSYHGAAIAHTEEFGPFRKGAVGVWGEYRDYASGGLSFTPRSTEQTLAGFAYQEADVGAFTVKAGLRFDHRQVTPSRQDTSREIGVRRARQFGGLSGAFSGVWNVGGGLSAGLRLMQSLRTPGIEELYSEGPHLASYSFEVGNPELDLERGWGTEVFARYDRTRLDASLAFYYNYIDDYIFPRNTGRRSRVQLPIYQYTGSTARMLGGEASATWRLNGRFTLEGSASYVHGTQVDAGRPLPQIPPLQGTAGVRYRQGALTLGTTLRAAAAQERVEEFEEPTEGYIVANAFAQYYFTTGHFLHTLDLGVENVFNTEYRDHLSRVRTIMPEPGRNLKLLYKVYF